MDQKNWTGLSFAELAQAGRVMPTIAKELAEYYLNKKYENLKFDVKTYLEEKKNLIQILERKISEKNAWFPGDPFRGTDKNLFINTDRPCQWNL